MNRCRPPRTLVCAAALIGCSPTRGQPTYRNSSVFTVDAEDRPVQWICMVCHTAWLRFAADLDGDGLDEIGWTDVFSWEHRTHHVTHLSETVVETRRLSTAF
jgi:hypothetical protein